MIRIAFTGPESSGKTTISKLIATNFCGVWIEEYAREYLHQNGGNYVASDLEKIAIGQAEKWKNNDCKILICDTELTVLKIWSEMKYNQISLDLLTLYQEQHFDHYFLCKPDIPWEEDPLRENPKDRDKLFELYKIELEQNGRPFSILEGSVENRLRYCSQKINQLIQL